MVFDVTAVNDAPLTKRDRLATPRGHAAEVSVLGNDFDIEGDSLSVTGSSNPSHGSAACTAQGRCTYTPDAGFSGPDTFEYTAYDGKGGNSQGTVLVVVTMQDQRAGIADSKGTDHWLAFTPNFGTPELTLFITGDRSTTGTVEVGGIGYSASFSVTAGDVTTVQLPEDALAPSTSDGVHQRSVHVTAQDEVTVYGLNRIRATTDAFLGLPSDILGTDYVLAAWRNWSYSWNGTTLAVLATEDGTTVTITPAATTDSRTAGVPFDVSLDAGQVYQLIPHNAGIDLTGSEITSDKPVTVFGGNLCANIPAGRPASATTSSSSSRRPRVGKASSPLRSPPGSTATRSGSSPRTTARRSSSTVWPSARSTGGSSSSGSSTARPRSTPTSRCSSPSTRTARTSTVSRRIRS